MPPLRAIVFDTFGTVVDFHGSIVREGEEWNTRKGWHADWARLALAWRALYRPALDRIIAGKEPFRTVDELHREAIEELIPRFGLGGLTETETRDLSHMWHRLHPWPDVVPGLESLAERFIIAPLSNGNLSLLTDLSKFATLPWTVILGADLFQAYKPDPRVYHGAKQVLRCTDRNIMLVSAHAYDLRAAREYHYRTAYVRRPLEFGAGSPAELVRDDEFDFVVNGIDELAERLATETPE